MATNTASTNIARLRERVPSSPSASTFHTSAGPLILVHKDAAAVDANLNPQTLETAVNNSFVHGVPGGSYLTCHARLRGAGSFNALPELFAWGWFPTIQGGLEPAITPGVKGLWLPLEIAGASTDKTSGQIPGDSNVTVATDYRVSAPVSFYLSGAERVMVAVATAGTVTSGDSTTELDIIGFFNG